MKQFKKVIIVVILLLYLSGCAHDGQPLTNIQQCITSKQIEIVNSLFFNRKEANDDYLGEFRFESGLIDLPVVQGIDNDYYLKHAFDQTSDGKGTLFADYRNTLDDQNIIVYGHLVYYDDQAMFSPLQILRDEINYADNAFFDLVLEKEIWRYQIAYVFYYQLYNPKLEYFHPNYFDKLKPYVENLEKNAFYDTGITLNDEDHFMTLQTCVKYREDLRLIVVAKRVKIINTNEYKLFYLDFNPQ